jgi:hypothetical protein
MVQYPHGGKTDQYKASIRRQADARILREQEHWRGAMYLLGYAVECRLKARLMEIYEVNTLTDLERVLAKKFKKNTVDLKTHSLEYLFSFTNGRERLIGPNGNDKSLRAFQSCNRWTPSWRYNPKEGNKDECIHFFEAVDIFLKFISTNI